MRMFTRMDYYNTAYNRDVLYRFIKECFRDDYFNCDVNVRETSVFGLFLSSMWVLCGGAYIMRINWGTNTEDFRVHIGKFIHIELFDNAFPGYIMIAEGCNIFKYYIGNRDGVKVINCLMSKLRGEINESNLL